jgi:DNA-binding response OmpR family regulator
MRILVIEDEPRMLELLRKGLQEHDCAVMTALDGDSGLEIALSCEFDVILLDVGLPRRDGYDVIHRMRERACSTRVLMLSARDSEDDIIRGLDLGADDYMTKPFSFPELVARLQSITRSRPVEARRRIEACDLIVDPSRRSVIRANKHIDLSRSEFSLLVSLIRRAGQCVPRQSLMEGVWGTDVHVGPGALDVLVNSLRAKIDAPYPRKLIQTVRRSGYMLNGAAGEMEFRRP